jgi:mono/diheme cytochrome c family protein
MKHLPALMTVVLLATTLQAADAPAPEAGRAAPAECTPQGALRGDPERGRVLHAEHCAECHGLDGKAEVIVLHMDIPPRDQSEAAYMKTLPDSYLYLAICQGGAAVGRNFIMPAWAGVLGDQDIRDLIAWIRTFSGT